MELQLIEIYIPINRLDAFLSEIEEFHVIEKWHTQITDKEELVKILIKKKYTEEIFKFFRSK
ncbi:hypothetical protein JCM21714_3798 [Gracilibacillus boraciitolerans JCM 21714]|uniref:Uncharacterized protein n=1 Tax=Gracilibacillus boraciitolerans JCM 21714 TaxID=1298598 RepID=W4VP52_9BACI|nr:hypothetical protein [Gracilibacillus boraciitolerans]GAE94623.1 hypothetical protein JCM21714_3798 [Gracilibacillus boraciitolerans JCM 21714]